MKLILPPTTVVTKYTALQFVLGKGKPQPVKTEDRHTQPEEVSEILSTYINSKAKNALPRRRAVTPAHGMLYRVLAFLKIK